MRYREQLAAANKLVEGKDLVTEVKIVWMQELTKKPEEISFIEERLEGEEDKQGIESMYDLFIAIAEANPAPLLVRLRINQTNNIPRNFTIFDYKKDKDQG